MKPKSDSSSEPAPDSRINSNSDSEPKSTCPPRPSRFPAPPGLSFRPGSRAVCLQGRVRGKLGPLLRALRRRLPRCGGWLSGCRVKTATTIQMDFELLVNSVEELYPMLLEAGLEMAGASHLQLATLGNLNQHGVALPLGAVVEIRLEIALERSRFSLPDSPGLALA